jgi:hypothetical protein
MSITWVDGVMSSGGTNTRTVTIPPTAQLGDVALLILSRGANETPTTPTGWNLVTQQSASSLTTTVWWKSIDPTDPGATLAVTTATAGNSTLYLEVRRGVDGTSPIDAFASSADTVSSASHVTPAIAVTTTDSIVVEHVVDKSSTPGTAWTIPYSMTKRQERYNAGTGALTSVTTDSDAGVLPGAAGANTYTETTATPQAVKITIALKPGPPVSGGGGGTIAYAGTVCTSTRVTSAAFHTMTLTAGAATGDFLVGAASLDAPGAEIPSAGVTDDQNNLWNVDLVDIYGAVSTVLIFSCSVFHPLSVGSTVTLTLDKPHLRWAIAIEKFTGIATPEYDVLASEQHNSAAIDAGPTLHTNTAEELAFSAVSWRSVTAPSFIPGSGWSPGSLVHSLAGTYDRALATQYRMLSVIGAQTATGTISPVDFSETGVITYRASTGVNRVPIAKAGPSVQVNPGATVTLDGTQSFDRDGFITAYSWRQISGQAVTMSSATTAIVTFTAPAISAGAVLVFGLTVTDDSAAQSTESTVAITVTPARVAERLLVNGAWQDLTIRRLSGGTWT